MLLLLQSPLINVLEYITFDISHTLSIYVFRLLEPIFKSQYLETVEEMKKSSYISIMVDSSTDKSIKDLASVFARYMPQDSLTPRNTFLGVAELPHANADGYVSAIYQGNYSTNFKSLNISSSHFQDS